MVQVPVRNSAKRKEIVVSNIGRWFSYTGSLQSRFNCISSTHFKSRIRHLKGYVYIPPYKQWTIWWHFSDFTLHIILWLTCWRRRCMCVGSLTVCTAKRDLWFHNLLHAYSFNIRVLTFLYQMSYFVNQWKKSITQNMKAPKDFEWKLCIRFWKGLNCKYKLEWLFQHSEVQVYTNEVEQAIRKSVCYQLLVLFNKKKNKSNIQLWCQIIFFSTSKLAVIDILNRCGWKTVCISFMSM